MAGDRIDVNAILNGQEFIKILDSWNAAIAKNIENLKLLETQIRTIDTTLKGNNNTQSQVTETTNQITDAESKLLEIEKQLQKTEEQYKTTLNNIAKAKAENIQQIAQNKQKLKEEQDQIKRTTLEQKAQVQSVEGLTLKNKLLREQRNQLIVTDKDYKKNLKELNTEIEKNQKVIDSAKDSDQKRISTIGKYRSAILSVLGLSSAVYTIFNILKNGFNEIKSFSSAMSELKSVSNATTEEFKQLKNQALQLGAETPKTATEVVNLQTAYAKLGFTIQEILNVTKSTIQLSVATGMDLANSATIAGSTLRAFQMDASEMPHVLDVMAKGFATTALDIDNYSEAIKYVAPVAKATGFTIEEVTAMLGKLADAGIRGSMAGTGLRRILLEIAKIGGEPKDAFDKLAKAGISVAEANDEVGDRAQTALLILSNQKDKINELTESYKNANGALDEMATIMQDNLQGDITKATSAWSGFILGLDSGEGIISRVSRSLVQLWTNFLNTLTLANKSNKEIEEMVESANLADIFKNDILELEKYSKSNKNYSNTMIESIEKTKQSYLDEIDLLKIKRSELLKNDKVSADALNENTKNIEFNANQVEIQNKRIENINKYLLDQKKDITTETKQLSKEELEEIKKNKEKEQKAFEDNYKEIISLSKNAREQILNDLEDELNKDQNAQTQRYINGEISAETYADNLLKNQQEYLEAELDYAKNNGLDYQIYEDKLLELKLSKYNKDKDAFEKAEQKKREVLEKEAEARQKVEQDISSYQKQLYQSGFDLYSTLLSNRLDDIEDERDRELNLVGDNEAAKDAINNKYDKKEKALKRKQAIADKAESLFEIAINTAQGVLEYGKNPVTAVLVPWVIALGATQAAVVAAEKIPAYAHGVHNLQQDTFGIFGEAGRELAILPSGDAILSPNQATSMLFPQGTDILTHRETERALKEGMQVYNFNELAKLQKQTIKAINEKPTYNTYITKGGFKQFIDRNNSIAKFKKSKSN